MTRIGASPRAALWEGDRVMHTRVGFVVALGIAGLLAAPAPAVAAVVTYANLSGSPQTYTEQGLDHIGYYGVIGQAGHWHVASVGGDPYIYGHANCCSNMGRLELASGVPFTLVSMEVIVAGSLGATWTADTGATVTITTPGPFTFPGSFQGVQYVDIVFQGGTWGWDDLEFTPGGNLPDGDGDGMPDDWETAHGFDPADPSDAALDGDGDGLTNLDEYYAGTDPNVYEGPGTPTPLFPVGGETVSTSEPALEWTDVVDPNGDLVTYDVEVTLAGTVVASTTGLPELVGPNYWIPEAGLAEGGDYSWRVRAADPYVASPWSGFEDFFVNAVNEPPPAPRAISPASGTEVVELSPTFVFDGVEDPDREDVEYEIAVRSGDETLHLGFAETPDDAPVWDVEPVLEENGQYTWRVRAVDPHGAAGFWSGAPPFLVNQVEEPPGEVSILAPEDGIETEEPPATVVLSRSVDPEARAVSYRVQLARSDDFSDPAVDVELPAVAADEQPTWAPDEDGIVPPEPGDWHLRARAEDVRGEVSEWARATFEIVEPDDPEDPTPSDDDDAADDDDAGSDDEVEPTTCSMRGGSTGALMLVVPLAAARRRGGSQLA